MSNDEDILPDAARPYIGQMKNGSAPEANMAAVKAIEAVAEGPDADTLELDLFFSFVGEETTLTKTAAREKYDDERAQDLAETFVADQITIIRKEADGEVNECEVIGHVGNVSFKLYDELPGIKRGWDGPVSTLETTLSEAGVDVNIPEGNEWQALADAWLSHGREDGSINVVDEEPTTPAHHVAEDFITALRRTIPLTDFDEHESAPRGKWVYVPVDDDGPTDKVFVPYSVIETNASAENMEGYSTTVSILRNRGYVHRVREARRLDGLPYDGQERYIELDYDELVSAGIIDPDDLTEEVPE